MTKLTSLNEGKNSLWQAIKNYYEAWATLGSAFRLKAEAELLDAAHQKIKADEKFSSLNEVELENAKSVMRTLRDKLNQERQQILLLSLPFILFLAFIYSCVVILLEIIRIVFG